MEDALETYKRNGREIADQFTRHASTFPQCVTRLADELTTAKKDIGFGQMTDLADAMLLNMRGSWAKWRGALHLHEGRATRSQPL